MITSALQIDFDWIASGFRGGFKGINKTVPRLLVVHWELAGLRLSIEWHPNIDEVCMPIESNFEVSCHLCVLHEMVGKLAGNLCVKKLDELAALDTVASASAVLDSNVKIGTRAHNLGLVGFGEQDIFELAPIHFE